MVRTNSSDSLKTNEENLPFSLKKKKKNFLHTTPCSASGHVLFPSRKGRQEWPPPLPVSDLETGVQDPYPQSPLRWKTLSTSVDVSSLMYNQNWSYWRDRIGNLSGKSSPSPERRGLASVQWVFLTPPLLTGEFSVPGDREGWSGLAGVGRIARAGHRPSRHHASLAPPASGPENEPQGRRGRGGGTPARPLPRGTAAAAAEARGEAWRGRRRRGPCPPP